MYDLYDKREYYAELTERIAKCGKGDRILLMTMTFEPVIPEVASIITALETAARAGASIHFAIDARAFMHNNGYSDPSPFRSSRFMAPLWLHEDLPARLHPPYAAKQEVLQRLASFPNVHTTILNHPAHRFSVIFAGRSHIKAAIINDYVITGGCNLDNTSNIDMMIGWHDKKSSDELYQILKAGIETGNICKAFGKQDQTVRIDNNSRVLIDAGVRGQSAILDSALGLIDRASDWLVTTSQYFPNGITATHLLAARKRDIEMKLFCSNIRTHGFVGGVIEFVSRTIERLRVPADMLAHELPPGTPYLHAKLLATDKGFMIGSHNYVKAGTTFGTAEIALISTDPTLSKRAYQKFLDQLPN